MRMHREGKIFILAAVIDFFILTYIGLWYTSGFLQIFLILFATVYLFLILWFFRLPVRAIPENIEESVLAPADGTVVVIEKVIEKEYFNDERMQVSIFMSPLNVHVNYCPVSGEVIYNQYHPGKHLVAWKPKSSTENERMTTVIRNTKGEDILVRQIAGAVARRIANYTEPGYEINAGDEIGFIKFGSRVDVFLPLSANILVEIDQNITGKVDVLARLR
jgi:phosphatidylserine decarboxylase